MAPILLVIYLFIFVGIIFISWNYFNTPEDTDEHQAKPSKLDDFEGKKVVFDGHLDINRESSIKNELKTRNALVEERMTEDTHLLVTGKNPDWLVVDEAKSKGVTIVNEMDWQRLKKSDETIEKRRSAILIEKKKQVDSAKIV
ncbi:BRCT domain-containing protein [Zunongwangia endophytica]|uniref:BRCT domain-containing protein n=1 Tax=Zunongwangia endophytica TaxID=1808945 RepID=A0ABV8HA81_9FLAO|nr:BRCT domain-containing protein [Zunongwangia endophytica]MDN3593939.1 hypothetical protein [Zunongwangia endophytica]